MTKQLRFIPWLLIAALSVILTGSTFYKALTTSFTHDESYSYNHFVTASVADIFTYETVSPNNHLLNTLLMKTGASVFGPSEIVLRFPNFLAHLMFLVFSLLLLRKLSPWMILPLFILVNCNPYLLDFFSLARGNGLSYGFLMGSIWLFARYIEIPKYSCYFWSVLFAFLGVLSHFTLLYYFLSLMVVANLWPFLQRYVKSGNDSFSLRNFVRINTVNIVFLVLLALIMAGPVIKLIRADQLFYGGEQGFWKDTAGTLVETFFYGSDYGVFVVVAMKILILATLATSAGALCYILYKKDPVLFTRNSSLFLIFLILMITIFINVSQFYILGTKLPVRRYGLLYAPMFMLCLCFLVVFFSRLVQMRKSLLIPLYILALLVSVHTFSAFSSITFLDWVYEKDTKKVMGIFEQDVALNKPQQPVTLGITWLFEPTVNFYRQTHHLAWLREVNRDGPGITAPYYYVVREGLSTIPLQGKLPVILHDDGKTVFLKLK